MVIYSTSTWLFLILSCFSCTNNSNQKFRTQKKAASVPGLRVCCKSVVFSLEFLMATSLGVSWLPFSPKTLQTLRRTLPLSLSKSLHSKPLLHPSISRSPFILRLSHRRLSSRTSASASGGGENYDFDLFTIGAGSGGVRASRLAANFGASVAICELPFATISSDTAGGVGGT